MVLLVLLVVALATGCASRTPSPRATERGGNGGTLALVVQDRLGSNFRTEGWELYIDGRQVAHCEGSTPGSAPRVAYEDYLGPGMHTVTAVVRMRGHGNGVFAYLDRYRFKAEGRFDTGMLPGRLLTVKISALERGEATTPLEERPAIGFEESPQGPAPGLPRGCGPLR
jgi:hypothetical protein